MALPENKMEKNGRRSANSDAVQYDVNISVAQVLKVIGVFAGVLFLWIIRDVLGILFVALVLASALDPWVDKFSRYRIPRGLSILVTYIIFLGAFVLVFYLLIPPLLDQVSEILVSLRNITPQIESFYQYIVPGSDISLAKELNSNIASVNSTLSELTTSVFSAVTGVFGSIATLIFVLVITFYMTIEEEALKKFIRSIAPIQFQPYLVQKVNRIQTKMGAWLRGQLLLMLIIGVLSFIILVTLGVPYALVLACVAGLAEFVPFLGPIIAAVPAAFFAYTDAPWKAIAIIVLYAIMQQVENQIIVPQIMKKAVGLNPIVVIAVMLVGAKIAGIAGILLAVPATTIAWIFLEDIFQHKKEMDNKLETA